MVPISYTPFKQMESKLAAKGATNPGGLAAFIAAKKYGRGTLEAHAKAHTSLRNAKPVKKGKHHKQIAAFVARNSKGA